MQKILVALGVFILFSGTVYYALTVAPGTTPDTATATTTTETYSMVAVGLEFTHESGEAGYTRSLIDPINIPSQDFIDGVVLTRTADTLTPPPVGGEGPQTLSLAVYRNSERLWPAVWAMRNPELSNYALKRSEPVETVVSGANAVTYTADGLYMSTVTIIAHVGYIYVATGQSTDPTEQLYQDYENWLQSFVFVPSDDVLPTPTAEGTAEAITETETIEEGSTDETATSSESGARIDPRVACESALLYMTFPDGAAADAFVAACIAGEHPEVIERYISELGADPATI